MATIDQNTIKHVAQLANIPITPSETESFTHDFIKTLEVVNQLQKISVQDVTTTHQVTNLKNVLRDDEINHAKMLTQEQALANAKNTHQGYFVVPRILTK